MSDKTERVEDALNALDEPNSEEVKLATAKYTVRDVASVAARMALEGGEVGASLAVENDDEDVVTDVATIRFPGATVEAGSEGRADVSFPESGGSTPGTPRFLYTEFTFEDLVAETESYPLTDLTVPEGGLIFYGLSMLLEAFNDGNASSLAPTLYEQTENVTIAGTPTPSTLDGPPQNSYPPVIYGGSGGTLGSQDLPLLAASGDIVPLLYLGDSPAGDGSTGRLLVVVGYVPAVTDEGE